MSALGLTKQDLHQLANCEPKTHWIGLKHEKGVDQPRITVIEKSEYTCWNRLISYLGLGPLAATDFDLHRTFFFVMDRDWKSYIDRDKNSEEFIAYSKVSALVNQLSDHLCERYCKRAANNVFVQTQKEISRDPFKGISPNPLKGTFYWNPALTVGDLRNQLGRQFGFLNLSEFQIVEKKEGVSTFLNENQLLTQDMLPNVDISIRTADVLSLIHI